MMDDPDPPASRIGTPEHPFFFAIDGHSIRFIVAPAEHLEYPNVVLEDLRRACGCMGKDTKAFEVAPDKIVVLGGLKTIAHMEAMSFIGEAEKLGRLPPETWRAYIAGADQVIIARSDDNLSAEDKLSRIHQACDASVARLIFKGETLH